MGLDPSDWNIGHGTRSLLGGRSGVATCPRGESAQGLLPWARPPYVGPRPLRMPSEPPWIGLGPPHVPFGPLTGALDLRV